jgi:threonine dehydrogenase-like Zn-dependent dehydrogenase
MAQTMQAIVAHGPHDYRLEEMPVPVPGPGEVVIEVGACGICASDVKAYRGAPIYWGTETTKGFIEGPVIAGHEYAGRVVALGPGAAERHKVAVGDHIVAEQLIPCYECRFCRRGQYHMCVPHTIFGFKRWAHGGMAKFNLFPAASIVHPVPELLTAAEAAYIEPAACAWHAVERGNIQPGDVVVIGGAGNIGLCMVQIAKLYDPAAVVALATKDYRLDVARRVGADVTINVTQEDPVKRMLDLTEGYGCDVYVETSGQASGVLQALAMTRKLGTIVEFSVFKEPVLADWNVIGEQKELTIHGAHASPNVYEPVIDAMANRLIDVRPLLADAYPLSRFDDAIAAAMSGDVLKTLVIPA